MVDLGRQASELEDHQIVSWREMVELGRELGMEEETTLGREPSAHACDHRPHHRQAPSGPVAVATKPAFGQGRLDRGRGWSQKAHLVPGDQGLEKLQSPELVASMRGPGGSPGDQEDLHSGAPLYSPIVTAPSSSRPWARHLATVAWMAGMWVLLTLPGDALAPVDRVLPVWVPTWIDKPVHFLLFAVLGWLLQGSMLPHLRRPVGALVSLAVGISYGGLTEWWQLSVPGRSAELADMVFNSLGTVLGVVLRK